MSDDLRARLDEWDALSEAANGSTATDAALRAVLDLHRPYDAGFGPCCAGCESVPVYKVWPCSTVRRITASLTEAP